MIFAGNGIETSGKLHLPFLTPIEQRDFDLIVRSAKECGWLDETSHVAAVVMGDEIMITFTFGTQVVPWMYEHTTRWLYHLLRDLAQGTFQRHT